MLYSRYVAFNLKLQTNVNGFLFSEHNLSTVSARVEQKVAKKRIKDHIQKMYLCKQLSQICSAESCILEARSLEEVGGGFLKRR